MNANSDCDVCGIEDKLERMIQTKYKMARSLIATVERNVEPPPPEGEKTEKMKTAPKAGMWNFRKE